MLGRAIYLLAMMAFLWLALDLDHSGEVAKGTLAFMVAACCAWFAVQDSN